MGLARLNNFCLIIVGEVLYLFDANEFSFHLSKKRNSNETKEGLRLRQLYTLHLILEIVLICGNSSIVREEQT